MGNNVGNISVGLSLDNQQFAVRLDGESGRIARFTGHVQRSAIAVSGSSQAMNRFAASVGGIGQPMSQIGFLIQDFTSQLSTRGFGAGLQAASNNVQVLGASFGPMGLAVTSALGVAVGAIGTYLDFQHRMQKNTKATADSTSQMWQRMAADARNGAAEWRKATRISVGEDANIASNRGNSTFTQVGNQIDEVRSQMEGLRRERASLAAEFNRAIPFKISNVAGPSGRVAERVGVSLPGGFRSIVDANSREGAIFSRALGKRALERGLITPGEFKVLAELEKKFISLNDTLGQLGRREGALTTARGNLGESELERRRLAEADMQGIIGGTLSEAREKALRQFGTDEQKRAFEVRDRERDSIIRGSETPQDRFNRERQALIEANQKGIINADEAAKAIGTLSAEFDKQRIAVSRQPTTLPSFAAGSQETLTAINRAIRGAAPNKVVEKNTETTYKSVNKCVEKMESVRVQLTRNQVQVARF